MKIPEWISPEVWESLSNREKDFMRMVGKGTYTKKEIKRFLYIENDVTFWRIRGRIQKKIALGNKIEKGIGRKVKAKI